MLRHLPWVQEIRACSLGAAIAQSVVCSARCPAWCSVAGSTLLWASGSGDFSLRLTWVLTPFPLKLFRMRVKTEVLSVHTCILLYGFERSWHSCPRWVKAGNKHTLSVHHTCRRTVTPSKSVIGFLKKDHIPENLTKNSEFQRYSWEHRRRRRIAPRSSWSSHTSDLELKILVAYLLEAIHCGGIARTDWPSVSICFWIRYVSCSCNVSVKACKCF